eukprot:gene21899-42076_t
MRPASFNTRNVFHLHIKGQFDSLLPIYLHVLERDLAWLNADSERLFDEFRDLLLSNMESIEKRAQIDSGSSDRFARIPGTRMVIAYNTSKRDFGGYSVCILDTMTFGSLTPPLARFSLNPVWIFPHDSSLPYQFLPIDGDLTSHEEQR